MRKDFAKHQKPFPKDGDQKWASLDNTASIPSRGNELVKFNPMVDQMEGRQAAV
jgi:hypothetical protein